MAETYLNKTTLKLNGVSLTAPSSGGVIATQDWVNDNDDVGGSSPDLTNYISISKVGRFKAYNASIEVDTMDISDRMILCVNSGRSTSAGAVYVEPPSGTWYFFSGYGTSNFYAESNNTTVTKWECNPASIQICIRAN